MSQSKSPNHRDGGEVSNLRKSLTDLTKVVERVGTFQADQVNPLKLLNWAGYGLLIFFFIDVIEIFFLSNFRLFNAEAELNTIGQLIERIAVPMIGFGLIFIGGHTIRNKWERPWIKFFSWLTLVLAILFFLAVPVGVFNTVRLYRAYTQQVSSQEQQRTTQAQEQVKVFKGLLDKAQTPEQLQALLSQLNRQGNAPAVKDAEQVDEVKKQLTALVDNQVNQIPIQAQKVLTERRTSLIQRSVKWHLSALISSVLFFCFWKSTRWARQQR